MTLTRTTGGDQLDPHRFVVRRPPATAAGAAMQRQQRNGQAQLMPLASWIATGQNACGVSLLRLLIRTIPAANPPGGMARGYERITLGTSGALPLSDDRGLHLCCC